ncbi:MAG: NADH-quinone oxidoreductase subunit J, partial [Gammaproteobacteria bacterium]
MTTLLFYLFSALLLGSSIFVVTNRNPMYSVIALVFAFLNLAAIYLLLDAYFIAVLQVLIYAGAIMVLFLFVVMLLNVKPEKPIIGFIRFDKWWFAILAALFVVVFLLMGGPGANLLRQPAAAEAAAGTVQVVGTTLFERYLLPFELVSLL